MHYVLDWLTVFASDFMPLLRVAVTPRYPLREQHGRYPSIIERLIWVDLATDKPSHCHTTLALAEHVLNTLRKSFQLISGVALIWH